MGKEIKIIKSKKNNKGSINKPTRKLLPNEREIKLVIDSDLQSLISIINEPRPHNGFQRVE
jgi:hypothetical protein